jgi:hypothetical protein
MTSSRLRGALVVLLLSGLVDGCTSPATIGPGDSGVPDVVAAEDGIEANDAGVWPAAAALWTSFRILRPCVFPPECINGPCPVGFVVLVRTRLAGGGAEVRGGSGQLVSSDPPSYTFWDGFHPTVASGQVESSGGGTDPTFGTSTPVLWSLAVLFDQKPIDVYQALIGGTLNADGVPTSAAPPEAGTLTGCLSAQSTERVYIAVLGENLRQFLEACGATLDCSTSGSGTPDGYALEARWEGQAVTLVDSP